MKSQDNNCVIYRFRQACIRKFDGNVHWLCGIWDYVGDRPRIQDMHKGSRKADDDNVIAQLGPLRRYAQSLTRDAAQAEDLVHDTRAATRSRLRAMRPRPMTWSTIRCCAPMNTGQPSAPAGTSARWCHLFFP